MFDTTRTRADAAPGRHKLNTKPIDAGAFTATKTVSKPDPKKFTKRGEGGGGGAGAQKSATKTTLQNSGKVTIVNNTKKKKAEAFMKRSNPPNTDFRKYYERGDIPAQYLDGRVMWKIDLSLLDLIHYLPIFTSGLRELDHPIEFLAFEGTKNLLEQQAPKVAQVVPQLIMPLKDALNTRIPKVIIKVLKVIKIMVKCPGVGLALVPYYRQLLPIFNIFKEKNRNIGDGIDYSQRKEENIGDLIDSTLQDLEQFGGEDAFINIKYLIPTYQSATVS